MLEQHDKKENPQNLKIYFVCDMKTNLLWVHNLEAYTSLTLIKRKI